MRPDPAGIAINARAPDAYRQLLVAVRRTGRRGAHDLIIAATAGAAGRTVVSADRRAFDGLPGVTAIDHRSG
jgi:tRNA(fMet)-specific endonuclease VapC